MKLRAVEISDAAAFIDHYHRHNLESNEKNAEIFSPLEDNSLYVPATMIAGREKAWALPLDQPNWRRGWVIVREDGAIVGNCEIKGGNYPTSLHRCSIAMGLEKEARGLGHGHALLNTALEWAAQQDCLFWVDAQVFSHCQAARELAESFGFMAFGMMMDRYRVHGQSIDQIELSLQLREE